jgi:hypothetical protein
MSDITLPAIPGADDLLKRIQAILDEDGIPVIVAVDGRPGSETDRLAGYLAERITGMPPVVVLLADYRNPDGSYDAERLKGFLSGEASSEVVLLTGQCVVEGLQAIGEDPGIWCWIERTDYEGSPEEDTDAYVAKHDPELIADFVLRWSPDGGVVTAYVP